MSKVGEIRNRLVNYGIDDDWDFDKQRAYRQVNEFNLALSIITFSAWPIALGNKVYLGFLIQFIGFALYMSGFCLIARGKLKTARLLAIYTFETHMFIISFFALIHTNFVLMPSYSPVFVAFMLYPLVAALFDKSIFKHMIIALLQIFLIQLIGGAIADSGFPSFPIEKQDKLNFIITLYTIGMTSVIVYLIHSENRNVKIREINRSKELEKVLNEVEASREMISKQAIELKALNDSKDKFFSIVTHDLKSPYNTLLGFSAMLKESLSKDSDSWEYAKNLYDAALNNYNLLENLLEWSRSQRGSIQFNPTDFMLNEVIFKTINLVSTYAEKKNISIAERISNNLMINADRNLVNIIIRNILTNAIKYTYPGGEIIIEAKQVEKFAEISISDNGIGIPEIILNDLFTIDNKSSRTGTDQESGTGLGLILCKEFVELHGCRIWVESEVKKGSTFYFTLPLVGK
jgi:signal transduction histidine kinase